ncbi:hypothetical protein F511_04034 [Dorcoceras hygrometricum]|uniref:Uncharacterized protein n=1 Tax=Dorcoceras hygrometricum TaxID=472368 RepID=A0A2Z7BK68_9LAMI|nr:hypothetical protein F511_04034 [Dorcoceras hygrometricum]
MASAYYSNTQHIDFEYVLSMDDPGMVSMFQALMASGLEGFLGYSQPVQFPSSLVFDSPIVQIEQSAAFADTDEQMNNYLSNDSSLHFDDNDAAAASISLQIAPIPDVTEALNQLRASIEHISERDAGAKHKDTLLLHLHHLERNLTTRLDAHDRVLGALRKDSNDQRNVRRVVRENHQELNAKITLLDEQVAATRHDFLEFSAQAQQTLNIITAQLSELVVYINRGGNDKKGEVSSSRPPPDDQNRGSGNTGGGADTVRATDIAQRDIDNAQRNILERLMSADRAKERERRTVGLLGEIQQMEEFSRSVVGLFSAVGILRGAFLKGKSADCGFSADGYSIILIQSLLLLIVVTSSKGGSYSDQLVHTFWTLKPSAVAYLSEIEEWFCERRNQLGNKLNANQLVEASPEFRKQLNELNREKSRNQEQNLSDQRAKQFELEIMRRQFIRVQIDLLCCPHQVQICTVRTCSKSTKPAEALNAKDTKYNHSRTFQKPLQRLYALCPTD